MRAIASISVRDLDGGGSQREAVETARKILRAEDLALETHAMATDVEGDADKVLDAIEKIHASMHDAGRTRLSTTLTLETRTDKTPHLETRGAGAVVETPVVSG